MNKRITYIDTTKAYLILLVVLGHLLIVINPGYENRYIALIQTFIYIFHMPAFLIIHGLLINNSKYKNMRIKELVSKNIYSLIIPYIFFETLGIITRYLIYNQSISEGIINTLTIRCNIGADWFLIAMFIGNILYVLSIKYLDKTIILITIAISFIIPTFCNQSQITVVIGRALLGYGFIGIGNMMKELLLSKDGKLLFVLSSSITVLITLINYKFGSNDFYGCTINNPITLVIGGITGTYMMLSISKILDFRILTNIGRDSLIIMGTHQLVIYFITAVLSNSNLIVLSFIILVTTIIFEIIVVFVLNKYLPFLVNKNA